MKKNNYGEHVIFHSDTLGAEECEAVSVHECTGLIPNAPQNRYALKSYSEILSYSPESADIYRLKEEAEHTKSV